MEYPEENTEDMNKYKVVIVDDDEVAIGKLVMH